MSIRTIQDQLRGEYFDLLPRIRLTTEEVETEVRPEFCDFDEHDAAARGLITLNDLAGVRILAFPKRRVLQIDEALRNRFGHWTADPVPPAPGMANSLALKYHGFCGPYSGVRAEIQLISLLTGLFWEVEHAALYKTSERLRELHIPQRMQEHYAAVIRETVATSPAMRDN